MKLTNLRTNQLRNPLGFPVSSVSLSFQVEESTGKTLKEAQIRITDQADMSHIVYDSGISEEISRLGFVPDCQLEGGITGPYGPRQMTGIAASVNRPGLKEDAKNRYGMWSGLLPPLTGKPIR